jgi:hypothetical protein
MTKIMLAIVLAVALSGCRGGAGIAALTALGGFGRGLSGDYQPARQERANCIWMEIRPGFSSFSCN